jgi:cellulose synthase operon protein YhjU
MNYASLYFLLKTGLFYGLYLGFHWLLNLLLAVAAFWPLPAGRWQRMRPWLFWPLALVLLYHDSFLPTPQRIWSQLDALRGFSLDYLLELLHRLVSLRALLMLTGVLLLYTALARWLRFASLALLAILSVPLLATPTPGAAPTLAGTPGAPLALSSNDTELQAFYRSEHQRKLLLPDHVGGPAFDLIVLHVCSLSWDDLDYVKERNTPLLKRFDLVFSNFNSGASYSGPAMLRLLRGNCGQTSHGQLYKGADASCYTFPALEKIGFQAHGLLNHNGTYDNFAQTVEQEAGLAGHLDSNRMARVQMQSFDGSPIYDDYDLLSQWWSQRQQKGGAPVALYYNTISLHDGNRLPGYSSRSSLDTYKPRVQKLLADFDRFVSQLEASGRPVVLLLVPEHGASLRGDKVQISGMREIPNPSVTLVPAALKLIGIKGVPAQGGPILIKQQMSYFGLNTILADLLRDNPFAVGARPLAERLEPLQTTPFVAENDDVVMLRHTDGSFTLKSSDGTWVPYAWP